MSPHPRAPWRPLLATLLCSAALVGFVGYAPAANATPVTAATRRIQLAVLALLNSERRANHLPPLALDTQLNRSALAHTARMVGRQSLSHQLPGEAGLGARVSATRYRWSAVGENIGWTSRYSTAGALGIQLAMYHERAPYNWHRLNILSRAYRQVGIGVVLDARHHRVWLTQDFGRGR